MSAMEQNKNCFYNTLLTCWYMTPLETHNLLHQFFFLSVSRAPLFLRKQSSHLINVEYLKCASRQRPTLILLQSIILHPSIH